MYPAADIPLTHWNPSSRQHAGETQKTTVHIFDLICEWKSSKKV